MLRLRTRDKRFGADLAAFCREAEPPRSICDAVSTILKDVRKRGDRAVSDYARKFDGAALKRTQFRVKASELTAALKGLPAAERRALEAARKSILDYNRRGLPQGWTARSLQGAQIGEKFDPIRRVGIYVPGGEVPLVSTVLMTVTLARIAGCPEIAVFTPTKAGGKVAPGLLAALKISGVEEVYRFGGVQAIAAMAFGTETIRPVDKIFGPGNAYVCEAKRQVFGTVGVDSLPGPSELMVIADGKARPDYAAADLLAQAEHGSGREKIYLVGTSARLIDQIGAALELQLKEVSRSAKIREVLKNGFLAVEAKTLSEAAVLANQVAPEHLELLVGKAAGDRLIRAITTAGAIMIGNETPTALADFTAGPSHVLPTAGTGRFSSGLRVADFLRRTSLVRYDKKSVRKAEPIVAAFAAMEQLDAHGRSVTIRTL